MQASSRYRSTRRGTLAACCALLCLAGAAPFQGEPKPQAPEFKPLANLDEGPRAWLPADETLHYAVEVSFGPLQDVDVGLVILRAARAPAPTGETKESSAPAAEPAAPTLRELGSLEGVAKGSVLGHELIHTTRVRWMDGERPRVDLLEERRGSKNSTRSLVISKKDGQWEAAYQKDRHCRGCKDRAHFVEGFLPWSDPAHCDGCDSLDHRVWGKKIYFGVPADTVDILSAIYVARQFLASRAPTARLTILQSDDLWGVQLSRGERREIETPAGKFACVKVLISPALAQGNGIKGDAAKRFEALFGLHGNITIWADARSGIPIRIEGEAPVGPFDVSVCASLIRREGD